MNGAGAGAVRVWGIRHHGPGSARSVRAALDAFDPDVVLIEGPADADPLLPLVGHPGMTPPVALLAHAVDDPRVAAFWPFAAFSPEWQALRWAAAHGVGVRFCDLPTSAVLAPRDEPGEAEAADTEEKEEAAPARRARRDPLALLAAAAGYDDPERWWEDVVESRGTGATGDAADAGGPFDAITEAMAALRAEAPPAPAAERLREERREAHMRTVLRAARRAGHARVAVVCGAWHAPALVGPLPAAAADARTLKGLPRRRATLTWVPWTQGRLAASSGYGAGVTSPGWYAHLFAAPDRPVTRWLTAVAGVLRGEDLPVSSAHVIEAVRLADALAALRGRPLAGLAEVTEATRAVLCEGDDVLVDLVTRRLVVGEALGEVPEEAPTVPVAADLRAQARRLRLKIDAVEATLELDLRRPTDLGRSRLLHRLTLLGVRWGLPARADRRNLGTFRETWALRWRPELEVDLVEAAVWGTTVEAAATAKVTDAAQGAPLAEVTAAVEAALLAELPAALPPLLTALDARAALDLDVAHLMEAVPPLVRAGRYGDVRGTARAEIGRVTAAVVVRMCAGLPAALTGLDDDAAGALRDRLDAVHAALATVDAAGAGAGAGAGTGAGAGAGAGAAAGESLKDRWLVSLAAAAERDDVHGLLTGRLVRLLLDSARLDAAAAGLRLSRALSVGTPAVVKAAWIEGFLSGGGTLLVHDAALLDLLDDWVAGLESQAFTDVLPLLRRTFGTFTGPERSAVAGRLRRGPGAPSGAGGARLDPARAAAAEATVALLLGVAPTAAVPGGGDAVTGWVDR